LKMSLLCTERGATSSRKKKKQQPQMFEGGGKKEPDFGLMKAKKSGKTNETPDPSRKRKRGGKVQHRKSGRGGPSQKR